MKFDWDAAKAKANLAKHGVSFEEAEMIFEPQEPVVLRDEDHSDVEDRFYAIGFSDKQRLLTVCFAYRGEMIRIISARKATKQEAEIYAEEIEKRR